MTAAALFVPSVLIACVALATLVLRVRRARAAGACDARPCCTGCWYPLGGWSGSNCPECGADATVRGVACGPRRGRAFALVVALATAIAVFAAGATLTRVFDGAAEEETSHAWVSEASGVTARLEARYGGPEHASAAGSNWFRARLEIRRPGSKPADAPARTLVFDGRTGSPSADEVWSALAAATEGHKPSTTKDHKPSPTRDEAVGLVRMVSGFEGSVLEAKYAGMPLWGMLVREEPWSQISASGGYSVSPSWRGLALALLASLAILVIGATLSVRLFGWGTRRARDREWVGAAAGS